MWRSPTIKSSPLAIPARTMLRPEAKPDIDPEKAATPVRIMA
jgi:hypothetical protein